jgi:hypothetical protein
MKQKITYGWVVVALAVVAGILTIALTGVAFWLSYEHLHDVAGAHGLIPTSPRSWAWPATLDTFIVIGEVLILRASLLGRTDGWAVFLTAVGSGGSITLNVVGVGGHAGALDYVVAAVPPVAALLAFGALMRQVHGMIKAYLTEAVSEPANVPPVPVSQPTVKQPQRPSQPPSQGVSASQGRSVPMSPPPSGRPVPRKLRPKVSLVHPSRVSPGRGLLTTSETADMIGVPPSTIRTWKSRNQLVPAVAGPDVLYDLATVQAKIQERQKP